MTPSGMEPATLQLAAQCLNQLCHRVPLVFGRQDLISHAIKFFLTHFSSECISTVALKLRKVLFHILNFTHFIFKLEGKQPKYGKALYSAVYDICCVNLRFVLSADLMCSFYRALRNRDMTRSSRTS
jgi:hypothetical protein